MAKKIEFKSKIGTSHGEAAEAPGSGKAGAVVLIHEWFGITDHIRGLVDRFAKEGFLAVAPDLYHGKVVKTDAEAGAEMDKLNWGTAVSEIGAAADWARSQPRSNGKVATVGFCMGGALSFASAAGLSNLNAAVVFYGVPEEADWSKVTVPILAHFAKRDQWAKPELAQQIQKELQSRGRKMELHLYDAGHAFMRDTDPSRYDADSAKVAWERTLAFLHQQLG